MFEIGFSELVVIMVVALIVIGPERLPKVARTLGHLWGRAQRYVNGVKADIERDMAMEEFRLLKEKVQAEAAAAQQAVKQIDQHLEQEARQMNVAVSQVMQELPKQTQLPLHAAATSTESSPTPPAKS